MINIFFEEIDRIPEINNSIKKWIKSIIKLYEKKEGSINFIFCGDDYLLKINQQYLNHDYFTDVITFNYNERNCLSGDIYISLDTVKRNAFIFEVSFLEEILRVMIHGILHLIGFDDTTTELKDVMRKKEDDALERFKLNFR